MDQINNLRSEFLLSGILAHYLACPVCQGTQRQSIKRGSYVDQYIASFAKELKISADEVIGLFDIFECEYCKTIYCDPWLSGRGMNILYGLGHSQHILGWHDFYQWVQEPADNYLNRNVPLWNLLSEISGGIKIYGQMNCPFSGFLMYFKTRELNGKPVSEHVSGKIHKFQKSYLYPYDHGFINRFADFSYKVARKLKLADPKGKANFLNPNDISFRKIRNSMRLGSYRSGMDLTYRSKVRKESALPSKRYLIYQPTSCFWTTNCNSLNCSCRALCLSALDTPVIDFSDVHRDKIYFDMFGFFNCLDHFVEPKKVLEQALSHSRLVFIDTHKSSQEDVFSRQHLYAFGKDFLNAIKEKDWKVVDISHLANKPEQNCYLVSREIDLGKALQIER